MAVRTYSWVLVLAAVAAVTATAAAMPAGQVNCLSDTDCTKVLGQGHWCNVTDMICGSTWPGAKPCVCTDVKPPCAGKRIGMLYGAESGADTCYILCGAEQYDDPNTTCNTASCVAELGPPNVQNPQGGCGENQPATWNCNDLVYLGQPCAAHCVNCGNNDPGFCCG